MYIMKEIYPEKEFEMNEELSTSESLAEIQKSLDELKENNQNGVVTTLVLVAAAVGAVYWVTGKVVDRKVKRKVKQQKKEKS